MYNPLRVQTGWLRSGAALAVAEENVRELR